VASQGLSGLSAIRGRGVRSVALRSADAQVLFMSQSCPATAKPHPVQVHPTPGIQTALEQGNGLPGAGWSFRG
jgi:hypothetical protein